ncbi:MAG: GMC family oxidoreductase [Deltaproteobacteria bacterium]|nr:GMC family oxidoreductase [Deltaproteobacteria bacterium]
MEIFDVVVIGSGFGGSVSAMRLAQKGYKVAILEMGKRYRPKDFPKTNWNVKKYFWFPLLRCFGFQKITLLKKIMVLHGVGVGGGSLVYAATLPRPLSKCFESKAWPGSINWREELVRWYETAETMLGVAKNPKMFEGEKVLADLGQELGCDETYGPTDVGIYFEKPGETVSDPYFGGDGPDRTGCIHCGACMIGCPHGSKNTLDFNYLYFAEKWGAQVFPETKATVITPPKHENEPYVIATVSSTKWFRKKGPSFKARKVILAAGVLGTVELLLKNRDIYKTLPNLSPQLGKTVRTNGECLLGATSLESTHNLSQGIAIGASINAGEEIKIEQVRYPKGSSAMRLLAVPLTGKGNFLVRPLKLLANIVLHLPTLLRLLTVWDWASRTVILLVMQTSDTELNLTLSRSLFSGFRKVLSGFSVGNAVPTFMPLAQRAAKFVAKRINGIAQNAISEVLLDTPLTAHILGGAVLADSPEEGVVDTHHQVFGYKGLYICDGSVVPANLGANPSLTITALAERFCSLIPRH